MLDKDMDIQEPQIDMVREDLHHNTLYSNFQNVKHKDPKMSKRETKDYLESFSNKIDNRYVIGNPIG